jgi:hypothetical protein
MEAYYLYFAGRYDAGASGVPELLRNDTEGYGRVMKDTEE